ncbi:MAG: hypothetical protein WC786_06670, partial [Patescibacteria group bacterium]
MFKSRAIGDRVLSHVMDAAKTLAKHSRSPKLGSLTLVGPPGAEVLCDLTCVALNKEKLVTWWDQKQWAKEKEAANYFLNPINMKRIVEYATRYSFDKIQQMP